MKYGFDLDGVITALDLWRWNKYHKKKYSYPTKVIEALKIFKDCELINNPHDFMKKGDEFFIITARESYPEIIQETQEWLEKNGVYVEPDHLIFTNGLKGSENFRSLFNWKAFTAVNKVKDCEMKGVKIFFEDDPDIAEEMRATVRFWGFPLRSQEIEPPLKVFTFPRNQNLSKEELRVAMLCDWLKGAM